MGVPEAWDRRLGCPCRLGVAGLGYFVLFLLGLAPENVDDPARAPLAQALPIDAGLILLWGVQHSVMARQSFQRWWTRIMPARTERATYSMASGVALALVCAGWSPLPGVLFRVEDPSFAAVLTALGLSGGAVLLAASFEIDHFELFGLRQPWRALRGAPEPQPRFQPVAKGTGRPPA